MAKFRSTFDRYWPFWALAGIGIAIRIWWLWAVDTQPVTDFAWYVDRAAALARGQGYTTEHGATAYWPVGYPFALSLIFRVAGVSILAAKIFNSACCIFCSLLTASIIYRLIGSRTVAFVGGLAVTVSPWFVAYSGILASEPLYTALVLSAIAVTLWAPTLTRWSVAGIAIGVATLVRPQAILVPFAMAWLPRPKGQSVPKLWFAIAVCIFIALLMISPWVVRNKRTHNRLIFVSTNGGDNLWIGNNPMATGRYMMPPGRPDTPSHENTVDRFATLDAGQEIVRNPLHSLRLIGPKLEATFTTPSDVGYWAFQNSTGRLFTPGTGPERELFLQVRAYTFEFSRWLLWLAGIGLVGGAFSLAGRRIICVAVPQITLVALVTIVFFGNGRFVIPSIPFQVMLALAPVAAILDRRGALPQPDPDRWGYRL